jgi:RNA polymerase sigma-70 factor (ECF subfamily)
MGMILQSNQWNSDLLDTSTGLLCQLRVGDDTDAWGRFVALYNPYLYGWLRRQAVQHADAEDLVQETLAIVVGQVQDFQHSQRPGAFRNWLRTTLANRLRLFRRSERLRTASLTNSDLLARLGEALEKEEGPLVQTWDHDHDRYIARKFLEKIEPDFQPVTWLAFRRVVIQGCDPEQTAEELEISLDSVYAAKSRILKRLRQEAEDLLD